MAAFLSRGDELTGFQDLLRHNLKGSIHDIEVSFKDKGNIDQ